MRRRSFLTMGGAAGMALAMPGIAWAEGARYHARRPGTAARAARGARWPRAI